jgi:hypothetical protein
VDAHDYWMGMAFMFASKSKVKNATLLVENGDKLISYGLENPFTITSSSTYMVPSQIRAILNCNVEHYNTTMYCTSPPTMESVYTIVAKNSIKQVVFYPCKECDQDVIDVFLSVFCEINAYKCNLNWMRDYFDTIEHK